jgi:hypothetical protein
LRNGSPMALYCGSMANVCSPYSSPDRLLTTIFTYSRIGQEHSLVRRRLQSIHASKSLLLHRPPVLRSSKTSHAYARRGRPGWLTFISTSGTSINNTAATSFPLSSFSFHRSIVLVATSSHVCILRTTMVPKSLAIVP